MRAAFPKPLVIAKGQQYTFTVRAQVTPLRKGLQQGFPLGSCFADGHAEYSDDGVTWTQLDYPTDLPFVFELA